MADQTNQATEQATQQPLQDQLTQIGVLEKIDSAVLIFKTAKGNNLTIALPIDKAEQLGNRLVNAAITNRVLHALAGFNRRSGEVPANQPQETPAPAMNEPKDDVLPEPPKEINVQ